MIRTARVLMLLPLAFSDPTTAAAEVVLPSTYELAIDGEVFELELGKATTVNSREKPDVKYRLSLRVAREQHLKLNTVQLSYDRGCHVVDDDQPGARTITLANDAGFTMIISDLGGAIDLADRPKVLRLLVDNMVQSFRPQSEEEPAVSKIGRAAFEGMTGRFVSIQYQDREGYDRTCVVYLLVDDDHAVSCIVQYLDEDTAEIARLVKQTLDSVRPL